MSTEFSSILSGEVHLSIPSAFFPLEISENLSFGEAASGMAATVPEKQMY